MLATADNTVIDIPQTAVALALSKSSTEYIQRNNKTNTTKKYIQILRIHKFLK
jgi:hypothetical protein